MNMTTRSMQARSGAPHPASSGPAPRDRWVAVVANGDDDTFVARAERLKGAQMVQQETCTHKHDKASQAKDCAIKLRAKLSAA